MERLDVKQAERLGQGNGGRGPPSRPSNGRPHLGGLRLGPPHGEPGEPVQQGEHRDQEREPHVGGVLDGGDPEELGADPAVGRENRRKGFPNSYCSHHTGGYAAFFIPSTTNSTAVLICPLNRGKNIHRVPDRSRTHYPDPGPHR